MQHAVSRRPRTGAFAFDLEHSAPRPSAVGTILLLVATGIALFVVSTHRQHPAEIAAWILLAGLAASATADYFAGGAWNLVRADLFALAALYFLTLFEFIFPQPEFHIFVSKESMAEGVRLVLWGFAGLAVGRHLTNLKKSPFAELFVRPVSQKFMLSIFWFCVVLGYLHMLLPVRFNIFEMIHWFMEPRFSQPWTRGRLGDISTLLTELGLLLYLIPPLAGIFFGRRGRYSATALFFVGCVFFVTLFYGFTSGTRNLFAVFLLTFLIGYTFAVPRRNTGELLWISGSAAVMLLVSTVLMLEFRAVGFKNWIAGVRFSEEPVERTLAVDYNLYAVSQLTEVIPRIHDHLGAEVLWVALVRPVPRFLWKGKPEGLSFSIEEAVGAEGWTVATTFVGEAYMAYGAVGVFLIALSMGVLIGWWGHLSSPRNSEFGILVYASGFFAVGITMRSLMQFTTAILPTLFALLVGAILIQRVRRRMTRTGRPTAGRRP